MKSSTKTVQHVHILGAASWAAESWPEDRNYYATPKPTHDARLGFTEYGRLPQGLLETGTQPVWFDEVYFYRPVKIA